MSGAPETARDQNADPQHGEPREMLVEHLAPSGETYGMRSKDTSAIFACPVAVRSTGVVWGQWRCGVSARNIPCQLWDYFVVAEPDARDKYTNLRVEADKLGITDQPTKTVKGLVLVQAPPFSDYGYGDRNRAEGKVAGRDTLPIRIGRADAPLLAGRGRKTIPPHPQSRWRPSS